MHSIMPQRIAFYLTSLLCPDRRIEGIKKLADRYFTVQDYEVRVSKSKPECNERTASSK